MPEEQQFAVVFEASGEVAPAAERDEGGEQPAEVEEGER